MDPDVSPSSDDGEAPEPKNFVEMLARARDALRDERRRRRRLEIELRAAQTGKEEPVGGPAPMHWKQKIVDLALENFVAMDIIAEKQRCIAELECRLSEATAAQPRVALDAPARGPLVRKHQPKTHYAQMISSAGGSKSSPATGKKFQALTPPRTAAATSSPRSKKFCEATPPQKTPPGRKRTQSANAMPLRSAKGMEMGSSGSNQKEKGVANGSGMCGSATATPLSVRSAPSPCGHLSPYNEAMINRLRRSIAPRPTKEQVGVVAHAMILEAVKFFARKGVNLPLARLAPCQYRIGSRKVNVGVDSGTLVVKAGGGHVDFLEYVERNRLTTSSI